jgi:Flp pilus assembly protein CpaB
VKNSRKPSLRALIATRRGAFTLAALCALLAVVVLLVAMNQFRHSVAGNAQQSTVLVSTAEIQKGTSADVLASKSLYKVVPVLATQISSGAITNAGSLVGKTAASTILPGEQLTFADFTTSKTTAAVSALTSPTERAIAVTLDAAHSVDGTLAAGDQVDVYGDTGDSPTTHVVALLVPDALVLKAPPLGTSAGTYVLGVSDTLSSRVMLTADNGQVWLALRGTNASNPPATAVNRFNLYLGDVPSLVPTYPAASTGGQQ